MKYIFILLLTAASFISKAQYTVDTVPNQKLVNNSYVSNPDNILSEETVARIDMLLDSLERKTSVQVAVVALYSIGDEDHIDFAQQLFTKWGIGNNENDNGLLVLLVEDKHNLRFHTGYGLESTLTDALCKRIQENYMVPEFKSGDYNAGMLAGLNEVNKVLTDPNYAEELMAPEVSNDSHVGEYTGLVIFMATFVAPFFLIVFLVKALGGKFADSKKPASTLYPEMRLTKRNWLLLYILPPIGIIVFYGILPTDMASVLCFATLYVYFIATLFHRLWRTKKVISRLLVHNKYYEIVEFLRKQQGFWVAMIFPFPIPFFFYFFYHLGRKKIYRNHSRACKLCEGNMRKLSEKKEDPFLSENKQMEETLRSNDYDIWQCEACTATEEWVYPNRNSKYANCPKCNTKAYYLSKSKTLVSATYSSSGKGERTHECKFCGHVKKSPYTIAKLVASSSSSGGGSSGSSSSSSGGSWGGGSSGGGGASSSW